MKTTKINQANKNKLFNWKFSVVDQRKKSVYTYCIFFALYNKFSHRLFQVFRAGAGATEMIMVLTFGERKSRIVRET